MGPYLKQIPPEIPKQMVQSISNQTIAPAQHIRHQGTQRTHSREPY
jgi:hypothetical protein